MHDQLGPFSNTSSRWHGLAGTATGQREAQGRGRGVEHRDKHEGGSAEGGHRHEGGCRGGHLHSGLDGHMHRSSILVEGQSAISYPPTQGVSWASCDEYGVDWRL
eukprot:TRINITY_DN6286_c0_g2_i4.p3 TRINITY_DN6286_c0_g2~~TRINITY_DN6286_c0_g2_i4.p3  ORF type:complete len:105 (+),score=6.54 TRINITY_DN6286_c0_g2_i4:332-646(+)